MSRAVTRHWRRSVCVQQQRQPRKSGSACVTHAWDATQGSRGASARTPTILSAVHTAFTQRPKYKFRGWDAINIDAPPRPCKLGCKLGHCDAEDFMDLFIYVVLGQRGKLFFINEGFKFWSIEKHSSLRKIYFPNKIWEIILTRQVILRKDEREMWLTDKFEENYKLPELHCFNRKITIELFNISKIKA